MMTLSPATRFEHLLSTPEWDVPISDIDAVTPHRAAAMLDALMTGSETWPESRTLFPEAITTWVANRGGWKQFCRHSCLTPDTLTHLLPLVDLDRVRRYRTTPVIVGCSVADCAVADGIPRSWLLDSENRYDWITSFDCYADIFSETVNDLAKKRDNFGVSVDVSASVDSALNATPVAVNPSVHDSFAYPVWREVRQMIGPVTAHLPKGLKF